MKSRRFNPCSLFQKRQDVEHSKAGKNETGLPPSLCTVQLKDGSLFRSQLEDKKLLSLEGALEASLFPQILVCRLAKNIAGTTLVVEQTMMKKPVMLLVLPSTTVSGKVHRYVLVSHVVQHTAVTTVIGARAPPSEPSDGGGCVFQSSKTERTKAASGMRRTWPTQRHTIRANRTSQGSEYVRPQSLTACRRTWRHSTANQEECARAPSIHPRRVTNCTLREVRVL